MRVGDFKGNWISKLAQSAARSFKSTEKYIYINCLVQFTFFKFPCFDLPNWCPRFIAIPQPSLNENVDIYVYTFLCPIVGGRVLGGIANFGKKTVKFI